MKNERHISFVMVARFTGLADAGNMLSRRGMNMGGWNHRFANVYSNSAPTAQRIQAAAPAPSEVGGDVGLHVSYPRLEERQPGPPSREQVLRGLHGILAPSSKRGTKRRIA